MKVSTIPAADLTAVPFLAPRGGVILSEAPVSPACLNVPMTKRHSSILPAGRGQFAEKWLYLQHRQSSEGREAQKLRSQFKCNVRNDLKKPQSEKHTSYCWTFPTKKARCNLMGTLRLGGCVFLFTLRDPHITNMIFLFSSRQLLDILASVWQWIQEELISFFFWGRGGETARGHTVNVKSHSKNKHSPYLH